MGGEETATTPPVEEPTTASAIAHVSAWRWQSRRLSGPPSFVALAVELPLLGAEVRCGPAVARTCGEGPR